MAKPEKETTYSSNTLSLTEIKSGGRKGFWLYDKTRGMNLAMREESREAALLKALLYYQNRLRDIENSYCGLKSQVNGFVEQFLEEREISFEGVYTTELINTLAD